MIIIFIIITSAINIKSDKKNNNTCNYNNGNNICNKNIAIKITKHAIIFYKKTITIAVISTMKLNLAITKITAVTIIVTEVITIAVIVTMTMTTTTITTTTTQRQRQR